MYVSLCIVATQVHDRFDIRSSVILRPSSSFSTVPVCNSQGGSQSNRVISCRVEMVAESGSNRRGSDSMRGSSSSTTAGPLDGLSGAPASSAAEREDTTGPEAGLGIGPSSRQMSMHSILEVVDAVVPEDGDNHRGAEAEAPVDPKTAVGDGKPAMIAEDPEDDPRVRAM